MMKMEIQLTWLMMFLPVFSLTWKIEKNFKNSQLQISEVYL